MTVGELVHRAVPRPVRTRRAHHAGSGTWAVAVAAALPVVLATSWLVADARQPARYSPRRQTISVAAGHAGTDRWVMTAGLLAIGAGYLVVAALLEPELGVMGCLGFVATGVCGLGVALCPESAHGPTVDHEFWSVLGGVMLVAGPLFTHLGAAGRHGPAVVPVAACIGFLALTAWLAIELYVARSAGAAERVTTTVEVSWPLAVAISRRHRATG